MAGPNPHSRKSYQSVRTCIQSVGDDDLRESAVARDDTDDSGEDDVPEVSSRGLRLLLRRPNRGLPRRSVMVAVQRPVSFASGLSSRVKKGRNSSRASFSVATLSITLMAVEPQAKA
ncbi:hypothetical protein BESB_025090 [Besnoitia besnoiti]|uniref:Uncharacterized protein n=1 Tax=Besnoitia besnoiti TaxID=94643 RepID=A0A2A9M7A7_BESBE|nr:uncharacterized protein BESB_025090 [Besnoitia besnoiti]PFH31543.1 hypothetical protein BESB_025090 [Besnoitia besnoiti]